MDCPFRFTDPLPIRVGIVGTGYAAKLRAEALKSDPRASLVAVAGHTPEKTEEFSHIYQTAAAVSWPQLVERDDIDLVVISTINRDHGPIVRAALQRGKHVVVEYPLSVDPVEAAALIPLSQQQGKLLHVEHIELLGGVHNAIKASLATVGPVFYVRYVTITPKHPAPRRWSYHPELFGFPLIAALSRLHRFTDLWGEVAAVRCQTQYGSREGMTSQPPKDFYRGVLCNTQLNFRNGVVGEIVYGKGETFWQSENTFTVYGEEGTLIFTPERGQLWQGEAPQPIEVGTRRGLFAKDTMMVLDHLMEGVPLYVDPVASLYTLQVADAIRMAAETGETILL